MNKVCWKGYIGKNSGNQAGEKFVPRCQQENDLGFDLEFVGITSDRSFYM